MSEFICAPRGEVNGRLRVPGDKSISHRSIMLASIATGRSHISGFLCGEDSLNTIRAFQKMGVKIERKGDQVEVIGVGSDGLTRPLEDLDMGNSGTAMRLLLGLLAGQSFDSCLIGDASLSGRPMSRVIDPLKQMAARIESEEGGRAPLRIKGGQKLKTIEYDMPVASAQVKSCLLLAGLNAEGETVIHEPAPTRDHSERMLRSFGVQVHSNGNEVRLAGRQKLTSCKIEVPADISSAAFFMVAAAISSDSQIILERVGINPTRTGVIDILKLMGADIQLQNLQQLGDEPIADICVRSSTLQGIDIPSALVPLAIDEFPVLFIAAACAAGTTRLSGAAELKVKESDRIQSMANGLEKLGVDVEVTDDGIIIQGGQMGGGQVDSHGDHRIAMAFTVASLKSRNEICISNCDNVNTSFPGFVEMARQCGIRVSLNDE